MNCPTCSQTLPRTFTLLAKLLLLALLSLLPAAPIYATTHTGAALDQAALEAFLDDFVPAQLAEENIPGAAVVVVHNGETVLSKGYGFADAASSMPVDPHQTLFRTGSVGKLFTWTAVMQLVEQGHLDLQADVNTYLDFAIPPAFGEPITLVHLMTHTPGFENLGEDLFVLSEAEKMPLRDYLIRHMPARVYAPGTVGAYSNYGAALAGYIVERVSGLPFEDYAEAHILAPLGMHRTTLRQPVPEPLAADLAPGHGWVEGQHVPGEFIFVSPHPAGAASAAPDDLASFMLAYLEGGQANGAQLLAPDTIETIFTHHYSGDARLLGMTLGWMERRMYDRRVLYHKGSIVAFHAGLYLIPEENLGLYVVYNGVNAVFAPDPLFDALLAQFFPATAGSPTTDANSDVSPASSAPYQAHAGEYHQAVADYSSMGKVLRVLETGQVAATPEGLLAVTIAGQTEHYREVGAGVFRGETRGDQLIFQTDANGRKWLLRDGEAHFAFFQPPWYALSGVTVLTLIGGLLLFVGSGLGGLIRWGIRRGRSRTGPPTAHAAWPVSRWGWFAAFCFGLLLVIYLITFVSILGDMHPVYGMPQIMFGTPPNAAILILLPWLLALAALAMVAAVILGWLGKSSDWSILGRLHYSLLTIMAIAVLSILAYWNLWQLPA